jgi:hypothetical protein
MGMPLPAHLAQRSQQTQVFTNLPRLGAEAWADAWPMPPSEPLQTPPRASTQPASSPFSSSSPSPSSSFPPQQQIARSPTPAQGRPGGRAAGLGGRAIMQAAMAADRTLSSPLASSPLRPPELSQPGLDPTRAFLTGATASPLQRMHSGEGPSSDLLEEIEAGEERAFLVPHNPDARLGRRHLLRLPGLLPGRRRAVRREAGDRR